MDHAEVIERLDEAFVGPGKIWSIETDRTLERMALREHLDSCVDCRGEYDALVLTAAALSVAAPDMLAAPAGARDRVLARVREAGVARGAGDTEARRTADVKPVPRSRRAVPSWAALAVAASIILLVLGGVLGRTVFPVADPAADRTRQLASLAGAMTDLLADPAHRAVRLREAMSPDAGADAGLVLVSGDGRRLAVTSNALDDTAGRLYDCYVERNGERTLIGPMHFADGLSYWAGPVRLADGLGRPGDRFIVVERRPDATPELSATF